MNREILFRGKNEKGEWVFGGYVFREGKTISPEQHYVYINNAPRLHVVDVQGETVGQYSGEDDVDGNKIFEGDIIEDIGRKLLGAVVFEDGSFWCKINLRIRELIHYNMHGRSDGWIIIGNIFDNPELLKEENKKPT